MKEITQSMLKELGIDKDTPFDASQSSDGFLFIFDADQEGQFLIQKFADKDQIKFLNTPTNSLEDVKISTKDYKSGQSVLSCGEVDIILIKLKSSYFWNPNSFKKTFTSNSLKVGD